MIPPDPALTFTPGRVAGLARWAAFLPEAGRRYAERRNFDGGPGHRANVSALSPWIRHRLVREDEVVAAALARHGDLAAEKFIQEVVWRTYWKGWLEQRPTVWTRYRAAVAAGLDALEREPDLRARWEQATTGRTGLACFDAWARELLDVGYLHNHARLWFASLWIFTLELPWALGADFFLRHLLDGDPASNTLSWRWVGGLQTPGKIYLARADNIARFTAGRFPAATGLATVAQPLREAPLDPPRPVPAAETLERGAPLGWLITEEDCDPLSFDLPADAIRAVAGVTAVSARSPLPAGPLPAAFARGAVDDALARLGAALGCPTVHWPAGVGAATVIDWARAAGVARIATAYAPVGPTAEWLAGLRAPLARAGITLTVPRRAWDDALWPLATRGFFPFKERVPAALRRLGLGGRPGAA
jgi:deoxyribodipyrimidine photo-lyase